MIYSKIIIYISIFKLLKKFFISNQYIDFINIFFKIENNIFFLYYLYNLLLFYQSMSDMQKEDENLIKLLQL